MQAMPAAMGEAVGWRMPFTLGHEIGGWVHEVGDGVTDVEVGRAVAVVSPQSCGRCGWCRRGHDIRCDASGAGRGYGRDGGLAPYVLVDSVRALLPLGSLDPKRAAPLTDAGATTMHGVRRVLPQLTGASTAVVIGAGGLGAFAVQLLRACSAANVIAVDRNEARRALALELGAHDVLDGVDGGTVGALRRITGGGADVVLDIVGTGETIDAGLGALRKGGAFALIGAAGGRSSRPWFGGIPTDAEVFTYQGSNIADAIDVIALAEAGAIRVDIDEFPLDAVADAYAAMEAGALRGRAVVVPPA
jgi:propanol-preferring alcohol dehydrogenase